MLAIRAALAVVVLASLPFGRGVSPAAAQSPSPLSERWRIDLPDGARVATDDPYIDQEVRGPNGELIVGFSETSSTQPIVPARLGWLLVPEYGPTYGRPPPVGECSIRQEPRSTNQPVLTWFRCGDVDGALIEHSDGRLLQAHMPRSEMARAVVRSLSPRRVPDRPTSDGWSDFHSASRPLFAARRGPNEGFVWIAELAPPGERELVVMLADSWATRADVDTDTKVMLQGRWFRAYVDPEALTVEIPLEPQCEPGHRMLLRGYAVSPPSFARLARLLEEARPSERARGCPLAQPAVRKADAGVEVDGLSPWPVLVTTIAVLLIVGVIVFGKRRRRRV